MKMDALQVISELNKFDKMKKEIVGYRVLEDCRVGFFQREYEYGQKLIINIDGYGDKWEGVEYYNSLPVLFEPIYETKND